MAEVLTKEKTINEIVKKAKRLDKFELQILLAKIRVKIMKKECIKPASDSPEKIKPPTMEGIDMWKHESRK